MNVTTLKRCGYGVAVFFAVMAVTKLVNAENTAAKTNTIVLSKKNTLTFRSVFTDQSVGTAQLRAMELSANLAKDQSMYLYLDTPGGDIIAGEQLITTLKGLPNEVKTITSFAASMGFVTAQSLGERYILPNGVLMSHRAKVGVQGQIPGEFNTQSSFWATYVTDIEGQMAARLSMPLNAYQSLVHDEYWVKGDKAVTDHAADQVINVRCGEDLRGETSETINTIFGAINVVWSECPLVSAPISINFGNIEGNALEVEKIKITTFKVLNNRREFVNDPILQQNYFRFVK